MIFNEALIMSKFPYEKPNPGQLEAIDQALHAVLDSDVKHIIIEAPTGIGKSAIATTIHKLADKLNSKFNTTIMTSTRGLQMQYIEQFPEINNLYGKNNYKCIHSCGPYRSVECKTKIVTKKCNPEKSCDYILARMPWTKSNFRISNHSFIIEACPSIYEYDNNGLSDLIIIDESHELEQNVVEHSKIKISPKEMDKIPEIKLMMSKMFAMFVQYKAEESFSISYEDINELKSIHHKISSYIIYIKEQMKNVNNISKYNSTLESLEELNDDMELLVDDRIKWIKIKNEKELIEIKPISAKYVTDHAIFRKADKFIHMTSTICGIDTYCESLGIKDGEYIHIEIDNPIPVENRLVNYYPMTKVSGAIDYNKLVDGIDLICSHHENESGIIHTVSFQLANEIFSRSKNKSRMIVSNDRREIISHLQKKNGIVLSPSIEKGFDAKDDLSRFQILAKVPYAFLGDPFIKYNANLTNNWYSRQAVLRLIQSCGRSIRGVNDYASTYILDLNFDRLYKENSDLFPKWFKDSVRK